MTLMGFMGCSNDTIDDTDVNPDRLYGDYQVSFDANEEFVRHYVQFRVAGPTGTTVRLSSGSISLDGEEMSIFNGDDAFINLYGTYYRRTGMYAMPNSSYLYSWERADGLVVENLATMPPAFEIIAPAEGDDHSGALTIALEGATLDANERYEVTVTSLVDVDAAPIIDRTINSGNELVIDGDAMADFPAGPVRLDVERVRSVPTQAGHESAGGRIRTAYKTTSTYFNIVD